MKGLLGDFVQYLKDAAPGGLLNPELQPVANYARDVAQGKYIERGANRYLGKGAGQEIMNAAIPGGGLLTFGGKMAKNAPIQLLDKARQMLKEGMDDATIWKQTGWWLGHPDKQPRFEIPDELASLNVPQGASYGYEQLQHPALQSQYPEMFANINQNIKPGDIAGSFARNKLTVTGPDPFTRRSIGLHELQHAIQRQEGFGRGGSVKGISDKFGLTNEDIAREIYNRLAGEVEARNVQARMNFSPEQRMNIPPWLTMDVPLEQQILR
jgi:hypothetical protein